MAGSSRGQGGKRGGGARSSKGYSSKREVGGRGIFVTCIRGKEGRCMDELLDVLDTHADRLYSPERIAEFEAQRTARAAAYAAAAAEGGAVVEEEPTVEPESEEEEEEEDDSIEASIARELAALKEERKGGKSGTLSEKKRKTGDRKKNRPRFQSVKTDCDCLCFVATAWPYDPVELTESIVTELQATAVSQTRYTQRLAPISFSCHALNVEQVTRDSHKLIEKHFTEWAAANNKTEVTYQIDPTVRNHNEPLSRPALIEILGSSIRSLSSPPLPNSTVPDRPTLTVTANLTTPDLVLVPVVLKSVYGLSIVEGKLWSGKKGKKFNLDGIGMEARRSKAEAEGPTGVRGTLELEKSGEEVGTVEVEKKEVE